MKTYFYFFMLCFGLSQMLYAQDAAYFQQSVDYKIDVTLDASKNELSGYITMKYRNNSPDTLRTFYMHLWPNAYKNTQTAFAKQKREDRDLRFEYMAASARGGIDSMDWRFGAESLNYTPHEGHVDIARFELNKPLAPNSEIEIRSPFRVKIPYSVSRLGRVGESFQLTQWYPKPAVYDAAGWHPMPYLDQGEFYSEFGHFEVNITLPKEYLVGATGTLESPEELAFLKARAAQDRANAYTRSAETKQKEETGLKTLRYTAARVHDFAWFADPKFYVQHDSCTLPTGQKIALWTFFTDYEKELWKESIVYLERSLRFYSNVVGTYPYPQVTAVQSALSAGAGMEYPMVTVIGPSYSKQALDEVITHEVGHNWFYGILGSNERVYAWMDEGFNSYVERRYMKHFYPEYTNSLYYGLGEVKDVDYQMYLQQVRQGKDQAIASKSADNTSNNYFLCAYSKPMMAFSYLEAYWGQAKMDSILKIYYETWKFKHPQPADVKRLFEQASGEDLSWFFDNLIGSRKALDYAVTGIDCCTDTKTQLHIKNKGKIAGPFSVARFNARGDTLGTRWYKGIAAGADTILVVGDAAKYRIDAAEQIPEINRQNNTLRKDGWFKKVEPLRFRFVTGVEDGQHSPLYYTPLLAYNTYDGLMLGVNLSNKGLVTKPFEYFVAPMFGFRALQWSGLGEVRYTWYGQGARYTRLGLGGRSFTKAYNSRSDYFTRYYRVHPYLQIQLPKAFARSTKTQTLDFRAILIGEQVGQFDTQGQFVDKTWRQRQALRANYSFSNNRTLNPWKYKVGAEYARYPNGSNTEQYLKLTAEAAWTIHYDKMHRRIDLRVFGGGFAWHTNRDFGAYPLQLVSRNSNDYWYDQYVFDRSTQTQWGKQQINAQEGFFKTYIDRATNDGHTNSLLLAFNIKADLPIDFPVQISWLRLRPYLDVAYSQNTEPSITVESPSERIYYSGGLELEFGQGIGGIVLPLIWSENYKKQIQAHLGSANLYTTSNYFQTIGFYLNLHALNPYDAFDTLTF